MGCRLTEKRWKILLAIVLAAVSLVIGFIVGTTVVPSTSSTVYSTDPQQCPTDATFCESVNVWRRSDAADMSQPNALNKRSSAVLDA